MRDHCWLDAAWSFVQTQLPTPPARVIEVGCGGLGGFVPALQAQGYDAVGIDPRAPESPGYHRVEFETFDPAEPVDALVGSTSLHHVADLDVVLDRMVAALVPGGRLVVVEWAWERFDDPTARWCFARLSPATPDHEDHEDHGQHDQSWLHHHHDHWIESGQDWDSYIARWVKSEGLHRADQILSGLDARFDRLSVTEGPYFFCDLADTTEADEQAAIDAGRIQATGIRYTAQARARLGSKP